MTSETRITRAQQMLKSIEWIKEALDGQYFYAVMGYTKDVIEDIEILNLEVRAFMKRG